MDFNNMIVRCSGLNEAYEALRLVEAYTNIIWENGNSPVEGGRFAWEIERNIPIDDKIALFFKHFRHTDGVHVHYRSEQYHYSGYINDLCAELENPRVVDFNEFAILLTSVDKIIPSNQDLMEFLEG